MRIAIRLLFLGFLSSVCLFSSVQASQTSTKRPPQFVVMAFDNCTELSRWKQLSLFLDKMQAQHKSIHFTFFVSGTNFLTDANKHLYVGPLHAPGEAEIPFGGTTEEVMQRILLINKLYSQGNEFGSHAVGHFDGSKWTAAEWEDEFKNYQSLFEHVVQNNHLSANYQLAYPYSEIVGFRAPYLGVDAGLYAALQAYHFRYDTSGIDNPTDWPKKADGLWHFDLVRLKIAGSGKKTISMDYNFYMAQSNAKDDPAHQTLYREQMMKTYIDYFMANYKGNRAPVRIGHHFTGFQGGVYDEALLAFADKVCGLPEVRCVSFRELADYLDKE